MSVRFDFITRQGNSLALTFRFRDAAGALVDLTGSGLTLTIDAAPAARRRYDLRVSSPVNGEAALSLSPDETRALPAGALPYEVERALGGSETTILTGVVIVNRGINNDR